MYQKLTSKNNRYNEDDDENEIELSDLDVMKISDTDHPCFETELIERVTCGMKSKPCENDIYGMPRRSNKNKPFNENLFPKFFQQNFAN